MRSSTARFLAAFSLVSLSITAAPRAFGQGAPPADPAKLEEAKRHMQAGASFYNDPSGHKCEEAIREFGKAFDLSGSLNALKGMAVCNLELERDGEAIEQYTKYLQGKGASIDPADKQQIEGDLNALKSAVAYINFTAPAGTWKLTDTRTPSRGFPITNRYQIGANSKKLGIHPGQHTFTASIEVFGARRTRPMVVIAVLLSFTLRVSYKLHVSQTASDDPHTALAATVEHALTGEAGNPVVLLGNRRRHRGRRVRHPNCRGGRLPRLRRRVARSP